MRIIIIIGYKCTIDIAKHAIEYLNQLFNK